MKTTPVLFCLVLLADVYGETSPNGNRVTALRWKPSFKQRNLDNDTILTYRASLGLKGKGNKTILRSGFYDSLERAYGDVVPPESWNWLSIPGIVTFIKQQRKCGSCYAFAALASIESALAIWSNTPNYDFSEQQMVDCSRGFGNFACQGGLMDNVYRYLRARGGVVRESRYPYRGNFGRCNIPRRALKFASKIGFANVVEDEDIIEKYLYLIGPVAVGVYAGAMSFFRYAGGIYNDPTQCNRMADHGVLLVGYGEENGMSYWIVKNSWGIGWGERGYMKLRRGRSGCKIIHMPSVTFPYWVAEDITAGQGVRHKWRTD